MAKPNHIELRSGERVEILYEDRSVLAVDKPRGWMLAPSSWKNTSRNLQAELTAGLRAGEFWARSRNLKYLRFVHRLDAEATGVLLLAKSPGAVGALGALFEGREVEKTYWAVVQGQPAKPEWECADKLVPDRSRKGRMKVDNLHGKDARTRFRVLQTGAGLTLVEATPLTGRTHQIRVHLAAGGTPVLGDELYGEGGSGQFPLALRAVCLAYRDPFTGRRICIRASGADFARGFGFGPEGRRGSGPEAGDQRLLAPASER